MTFDRLLDLKDSNQSEASQQFPTYFLRVGVKQHTHWKILGSVIDIFHILTLKSSQRSLLLSAVQAAREISHIVLDGELLPRPHHDVNPDLNNTSKKAPAFHLELRSVPGSRPALQKNRPT